MFSYCSCFSLDLILDDFWLSCKLNPTSNHENLSLKIVIQSRCCKLQGQTSKRNSKCALSNGDTSRTSLQALKVTGWGGRALRQPESLRDGKPASFRSCASAFSPSSVSLLRALVYKDKAHDGQGMTLHFSGCLGSNTAPDLGQVHDKGQGHLSELFNL